MREEKGYVIRCHDLFDGSTDFRGMKGIFSKTKAGLSAGDTYSFSGAKRALANIRRLCFEPDRYQYSIERLDEFYFTPGEDGESVRDYPLMKSSIDHAMTRLDELWNGNDFDNGDKMRINEVMGGGISSPPAILRIQRNRATVKNHSTAGMCEAGVCFGNMSLIFGGAGRESGSFSLWFMPGQGWNPAPFFSVI